MKRKVYTYSSISELDNHPKYDEISSSLNVTATNDMSEVLEKRYPEIKSLISIHRIMNRIIGDWDEEGIKFQQYINLSIVLREMNIPRGNINLYNSFVKNKKAVLDAIRMLVEANLYPEYINPVNDEEKLLKVVWGALEEEDCSFGRFRSRMAIYYSNSELFNQQILNEFKNIKSEMVFLHGFYFITPIQEQFFRLLEKTGKALVFLAKVDSRLTEVNKIWYENFSLENGFEPVEKWFKAKDLNLRNTGFGLLFEGDTYGLQPNNISIKKYKSEIDFIKDIERLEDEDFTLYTGDLLRTENLMKEFYPELFKRRHLLSYPVGQYIYQLHGMWNPTEKRMELTVDDIQTCFSSGWVIKGDANGLEHMLGLELLRTYVDDCRTIEDWESRLNLLKEIQVNISNNFERHLERMKEDEKKWHRIMSNPFLNLSCFSYDGDKLDELIDLISHLILIARKLFTGSHEVDLLEHLSRVKDLLNASEMSRLLEKEERLILEELNNRLTIRKFEVDKCLPEEISEAIMLIIGSGMLDEDDFERQARYSEPNLKPLYLAESSVIDGKSKVHLCMADEANLPGSTGTFAWPVTTSMLDRMEPRIPNNSISYYRNMKFIVEKSPLSNRYLFFSLLENNDVELSWISKEKSKDISPSPYFKILDAIYDIQIENSADNIECDVDKINEIEEYKPNKSLNIELEDIPVVEAQIDLIKCNLRYIYGYIMSNGPSYRSSFHYNFAISRLVESFTRIKSYSQTKIIEETLKLFPYLREVEKQSIVDHIGTSEDWGTDSLDNANYPSSRLDIHFLTRRNVDIGFKKLDEYRKESSSVSLNLDGISDYKICMYCPFVDNCPQAEHYKKENV